MLIELWRKVLTTDHSITCCGICGNEEGPGEGERFMRKPLRTHYVGATTRGPGQTPRPPWDLLPIYGAPPAG